MAKQGKISFVAGVLISINIIIGGGIYLGPTLMADKIGNASIFGWMFAALLMFPVIWNIALATRMFPGEGGFYNYCKTGINETAGFIAQWIYFLGFCAAGAVFVSKLSGILVEKTGFYLPTFYTLLIITAVCALNLLSVKLISKVQSLATILKLSPLFCIIALIPFYWDSSITFHVSDVWNVGSIMPIAIFGYLGFECCCNISHHLKGGPTKAFGVIITAFIAATTLYTLFHFGLLHIMGVDNLVAHGIPNFPSFLGLKSTLLVGFLNWLFAITLILNYFNSTYGLAMVSVDNLFCLAKKKYTFHSKLLTKVNEFDRPTKTIIAIGAVFFFFAGIVANMGVLIAFATLGVLTTLTLTVIAIFNVQYAKKDYKSLWKTMLGFASCLIFGYYAWTSIGNTTFSRFLTSLPMLFGIGAGYIMYKASKNKNLFKGSPWHILKSLFG